YHGGRSVEGCLWRCHGMSAFRYQAIETKGTAVSGMIEAEDRRSALRVLGERGIFPSNLELCGDARAAPAATVSGPVVQQPGLHFGTRIGRKEITAFTREMAALLEAAIPIPQALDSLGEEEE